MNHAIKWTMDHAIKIEKFLVKKFIEFNLKCIFRCNLTAKFYFVSLKRYIGFMFSFRFENMRNLCREWFVRLKCIKEWQLKKFTKKGIIAKKIRVNSFKTFIIKILLKECCSLYHKSINWKIIIFIWNHNCIEISVHEDYYTMNYRLKNIFIYLLHIELITENGLYVYKC